MQFRQVGVKTIPLCTDANTLFNSAARFSSAVSAESNEERVAGSIPADPDYLIGPLKPR
jgi:hypothetical protein